MKPRFKLTILLLTLLSLNTMSQTIYDITVADRNGNNVSLADYKGKVLLIVNTATRCGFTPQYEALEDIYKRLNQRGLEILDFPCNQFGQQAPGTEEEIHSFCQLNYGTEFPQFKSQRLGKLLDEMMLKADPEYASKPDIKWNFTKFLVDREGNIVARFEPTDDMTVVEAAIEKLL